MPRPTTSLRGNTTRYGCSVDIVRPACGVLPTLLPSCIGVPYETNYRVEFGPEDEEKGAEFQGQALPELSLPPIDVATCPRAVQGGGPEREKARQARKRAPLQVERVRANFVDLGTHKLPTWLSQWCGPM